MRKTVSLADGRTLSYLEVGDPQGTPVLFAMGTPSSAVGARAYEAAARRNGLRLLAVDKPGYGQSTRHPQASMRRRGKDVAELADALGLQRVALAGQSGGGPLALAGAHALGERASAVCLMFSYGPVHEAWARTSLNRFMTTTNFLARHAPGLMVVPVATLRTSLGDAERGVRWAKKMAPKMPPKDREMYESEEFALTCEGAADGFRNGNGPVCDEFRALGRPWGFRLEDIRTLTDLWQGTEDKQCPLVLARGMAERLPNATLHELPGFGHGFFGRELDDAFTLLRTRAVASTGAP